MKVAIPTIVVAVALFLLIIPKWSGYTVRSAPQSVGIVQTDSSPRAVDDYTCPMHPSIHRSHPGSCPICGMTLVKRGIASVPADLSTLSLKINSAQKTLAGVMTETARRRSIVRTIHAAGRLEYQEPLHHAVTARFAGRVERLFVASEGQYVRKGDPLLTIYSPDILTALDEYRAAMDAIHQTGEAAEVISAPAQSIAAESKNKLLLLGMTEDQIAAFLNDSSRTTVTVFAEFSGVILNMQARQQKYVDTGELLFDIAAANSLWLIGEAYEPDAPLIQRGEAVRTYFSARPERSVPGTIDFVSDRIDPDSRTVAFRVAIPNPAGKYRIGEYAEAYIDVTLPSMIVVPSSAVVTRAGTAIVWVEKNVAEYEPRRVVPGLQNGIMTQIMDGLAVGEKVVVHGGYLLDSESQLQNPDTLSGDDK